MVDSIFELNEIKQNFKPDIENKIQYGEVNTPFSLIEEILSVIPSYFFQDTTKKWLDPACGCGYFTMVLCNKLMNGLKYKIPNREKRKKHILENMIYMCEINKDNINTLKNTFGVNANIIHQDFLSTMNENNNKQFFDVIIGNPPYNSNGLKKVPTNSKLLKKQDGETQWIEFVKHSMSLLKENGYLNMIIPAIWMKPDKANMYEYLTQYRIHKIKAFSNTETKKIFKNQAQTPTCYFLLEKKEREHSDIYLYDRIIDSYIPYQLSYQTPIPLCGVSIVNKLIHFVKKYGSLEPIKTNLPNKQTFISHVQDKKHMYPNIRTCILESKIQPKLIIDYSSKPCKYYGEKKLVLANKMYGMPYFDKKGDYGISNRDNYVFLDYQDEEFEILKQFLSTKTILFIYDTTRYRMRYLEKYAFKFIPDITRMIYYFKYAKIENKDNIKINDNYLKNVFGFTQKEYETIQNANKKYDNLK